MPTSPYILGLDLGTNSLGWAVLASTGGTPTSLVESGVRIFEAGLDDLEIDGRGKSRNASRREARLTRRQLRRQTGRLNLLFRLLTDAGLLPRTAEPITHKNAHKLRAETIDALDRDLAATYPKQSNDGLLPYALRSKALHDKLAPFELGRALFHLGQRRGFQSHRKSLAKKEEDAGVVDSGIRGLEADMKAAGAQTLGEFFATVGTTQGRIRTRYTSRQMYRDEFEFIWSGQVEFHRAVLTDDLKARVARTIFFQRPLKSAKHLVGRCDLEPKKRRAAVALPMVQRFRYLQRINDLEAILPSGEKMVFNDEAYATQRKALIDRLETEGDATFAAFRKILKLPKGTRFNLEEGDETKIPGNRTESSLRAFFGARWEAFDAQTKESIIDDLRSFQNPDALARRASKMYGLTGEQAKEFSRLQLEDEYAAYSKAAIELLLPMLDAGLRLQTAIKQAYPERHARSVAPREMLPPVHTIWRDGVLVSESIGDLRNPVVARSLTEVRKVVNALVKRHGKPEQIRIELARDVRMTPKQRQAAVKRNRANEKERQKAAKKLLDELGLATPSRRDIEKAMLYIECNGRCPYSGNTIAFGPLFGDHPRYDIEHIIPFARSLDDSFVNKTLCEASINRRRKSTMTPYEAFSASDEEYRQIRLRVKDFQGNAAEEKLRRFTMNTEEAREFVDGWTSRQLNDTRYGSKLAKRYLGLLYGGVGDDGIDADGKRRVQATTGGLTAFMRNEWQLNGILGDGGAKSRNDHRHHAVDAIAIALAEPATVKKFSEAASRAKALGKRRFAPLPTPWPTFAADVRAAIDTTVVSHRVNRKVTGSLHKKTFYSPPRDEHGRLKDRGEWTHVRKPLNALTKKSVNDIVDARLREKVLTALGGGDPKLVFSSPENLPFFETKDGRKIPIAKARVRETASDKIRVGGRRGPARFVENESNHHMEVFKDTDSKGRQTGSARVINSLEANRRLCNKLPVIDRHDEGDKKFVFSLAPGEIIELGAPGSQDYRVVTSIWMTESGARLRIVAINDARKKADIEKVQPMLSKLMREGFRKVLVTPLGTIRKAND